MERQAQTVIDLTHTFGMDMPVYPGDPKVEISQVSSLEKDGCNDFLLQTVMHVGTHIDAPFHFIADGKMISDYPPEYFLGRGHLIDARERSITPKLLEGTPIEKGDIVLVLTGHSKKYRQEDYYKTYPIVSEDFAEKLVSFGVNILGLDTPSPDYHPYPIHKILLSKEILILENLTNLEALLGYKKFQIVALPPKLKTEAAITRVVAIL